MQTRSLMAVAVGLMALIGGAGNALAQTNWVWGDIGAVTISGSTTYTQTSGGYSLVSSGNGIWGTADAFQFMSQTLSGDMQITARLVSQQETIPGPRPV